MGLDEGLLLVLLFVTVSSRVQIPNDPPYIMNSIIIPAYNKQTTFVRIGNSWHCPTVKDMEDIRDWVKCHKDSWLARRKELPKLFGYDIKVKIFPILNPDNEYVWLLKRVNSDCKGAWSLEDIQNWKNVFSDSIEDPDFIIFVWGGVSIKKLNKFLMPFL